VQEILKRKLPMTVCPVSNVKIGPYEELQVHPIKKMIDAGLLVSVNSDDPAYLLTCINCSIIKRLQSDISDVFKEVTKAFDFGKEQITQLVKNSIQSSFLSEDEKIKMEQEVDHFVIQYKD
jgi:adenosine deaminase